MEQGDVIELLDTLYSMISEAWGVPLGNGTSSSGTRRKRPSLSARVRRRRPAP